MTKGNRPLNILLILCLIIIWFFVIKKAFFQTTVVPTIEKSSVAYQDIEPISIRKKSIVLKELKNPFIIGSNFSRSRTRVAKPVQRNVFIKTKTSVSWPTLEYYGYVGKNKGEDLRGLLKINNKIVRMKKGDKLEGVKLEKLYPDSIVVSLSNKLKTINRSQ